MNRKYKIRFKEVIGHNRWKRAKHQRNGDWVIIGISRQFFSPTEYEYRINFFGFDIRIWLEREFSKIRR